MHRLTTFFLYAFLMDGLLSVADALCRAYTHTGGPNDLGVLFSLTVLALGLFIFTAMVFTPRLSKRMLLPPILFLFYEVIWSVMFGDKGALPISIAQTLIAMGVIVGFKEHDNPQGGVQDFASKRPWFTWRNLFLTGSLNSAIVLCVFALIALSLTQKARYKLEQSTGRFMTIHQSGISLEERRFAKDGKEIRLIGMMHIAKSGFYDEVAKALPANASAVVLLEGVGDQEHLMRGKFGYSRMAKLFGFSAQEDSSFTKQAADGLKEARLNEDKQEPPKNLEYQKADIDLSELNPDTVNFIQAIGTLMHSANFQDALKEYSDLQPVLEKGSQTAFDDILNKRNEHLLGEIEKALETHTTIVVPWGAAHMPGIQDKIQKWGFVETKRSQHEAINFQNRALVDLVWLLDKMPGDVK